MIVSGVYCYDCKCFVYSRARHDMNCCLCYSENKNTVSQNYKVNNINKIVTDKRDINLMPKDIVINTTSCTNFSRFLGFETNLKYRGVILVMLELSTAKVLPEGVDFIYIDDEDIFFNRVS